MKFFKRILIKDGLVDYVKFNERLLIEKPTIDKALPTIIKKPVVVTHEGTEPVGEIVDAYYNSDDAQYYVGFNVWDETAEKLLENDHYISCTFDIIDGQKATEEYHNIQYDTKVNDLVFTNIAIVDKPKYQETKYYKNGLEENETNTEQTTEREEQDETKEKRQEDTTEKDTENSRENETDCGTDVKENKQEKTTITLLEQVRERIKNDPILQLKIEQWKRS